MISIPLLFEVSKIKYLLFRRFFRKHCCNQNTLLQSFEFEIGAGCASLTLVQSPGSEHEPAWARVKPTRCCCCESFSACVRHAEMISVLHLFVTFEHTSLDFVLVLECKNVESTSGNCQHSRDHPATRSS